MSSHEETSFARARRWSAGWNVLLSVAAVIGIVIMTNYLSARHYRRTELTRDERFSLSPLTTQLLRSLTNEVQVTVFFDRDEILFSSVTGLLKEYAETSPLIRVKLVDYARFPDEALLVKTRYKLASPDNKDMVIFDSQDRVRIVNQSELSDYDMKDLFEGRSREVKRKGFKGEQLFTSAILSVSDPKPPRAYMLRGHGEHSPTEEGEDGYSKFQSVLAANNIELEPLELRGTNDVPAECQVLIVARPRAVLLPDELEKLDRYLTSGGRMFAAFNFVTTTNRTGLEALLRKWGVEVGINVVIDPQNSTAGADLFATQFTDHPIMRPLVVGDTPLHLLLPRTIRPIVSKNPDAPKASALVLTGPNSTTVTRFKQFYPDPSPQDERGSAPVAVAVEKGQVEGIAASRGTTRLVVVGDSKFLSNDMIDRLANRDFASFAVNWLLDRSLLFGGIGPRPIHQYQVKLSAVQLQSVRWLLILGVPGSVLAIGGFVWMKRRS